MKRRLRAAWIAVVVACLFAGLGTFQPAAAQDEVKREITQIAGDLYRFQNKFHFSVFLVTPEGVIATDPINAEAAEWLEAEIRERFGQEIRYLILSHDHRDHSAGGEVFADTATVIAHENGPSAPSSARRRPTAVPDITFNDRMTIELGGKTVELIYPGLEPLGQPHRHAASPRSGRSSRSTSSR